MSNFGHGAGPIILAYEHIGPMARKRGLGVVGGSFFRQ